MWLDSAVCAAAEKGRGRIRATRRAARRGARGRGERQARVWGRSRSAAAVANDKRRTVGLLWPWRGLRGAPGRLSGTTAWPLDAPHPPVLHGRGPRLRDAGAFRVAACPRAARATVRRHGVDEGRPHPARRGLRDVQDSSKSPGRRNLPGSRRDAADGAAAGRGHGFASIPPPGEGTAPRGGQCVGVGRPAAADGGGTAISRPRADGRGPPRGSGRRGSNWPR